MNRKNLISGLALCTALFVSPTFAALHCNVGLIEVPTSGQTTGPSNPYPSTISVSGEGLVLTDINVQINGLSHTWPDDLNFLLVGPQGENLHFLADAGGGGDVVSIDLVFDDAAAAAIVDAGPMGSGTFQVSNYGAHVFEPPAPPVSAATTFATFNSTNPNGTWSLYTSDDAGGDSGEIDSGWCVEIAADASTLGPAVPIPTMGTFGLFLMATLLAVIGLLRRRTDVVKI